MYRVEWSESSLRVLATLLRIGNRRMRSQLTAAIQEAHALLERDPDQVGESRSEGVRITFVGPLAVRFRLNARLREVFVSHIWAIYWYM